MIKNMYNELNNNRLPKKLSSLIEEYEKNINAKWRLCAPEIEDSIYTAELREQISNIITIIGKNKADINIPYLNALDDKWKIWLLNCIDEGDVKKPHYPNPDAKNTKWWLNIESLDKIINYKKP